MIYHLIRSKPAARMAASPKQSLRVRGSTLHRTTSDCIPSGHRPFNTANIDLRPFRPKKPFRDQDMSMLQNGGGAPAAGQPTVETTTQSFMKDVIEESKRQPVLVDF